MTDERFEQDLKSTLREIAGGEAPMSLRNRVADLIDQAPVSRRLWFSPPMKLSLAAVAAVAVVVMAFLVVRPLVVGPTQSQTPEPSASASASSIEPTPSALPSATLEPTPVPTPGGVAWTGLEWTVGSTDKGSWWVINDVLPWSDGYVGVGESRHQDATSEPGTWHLTSPAFFTSADGLRWTIVQEDEPIDLNSGSEDRLPTRLVPVGDALLAIGSHFSPDTPNLWRSENGTTWSPVDSPTWRDLWFPPNHLISIAAGPTGLVAIGEERSDCCTRGPAVIAHSADGLTWDRLDLTSAFDRAYLWDVTAYAGGFVVVGRVGDADVVGAEPAVGVPAAWTSPDGVFWLAAEVEGSAAPGATLSTVIAGARGLFATGRQTDTIELSGQGPLSGWASTDGRSWQLVGEMGTNLPSATPFPGNVLGDGTRMVIFGRESCKTTELSAWTSLDGVTWTHLAFSGTTAYLSLISGPICNDDGTEGWMAGTPVVTYAAVMADGVFVVTSSSAPTAPTYWFLAATTK